MLFHKVSNIYHGHFDVLFINRNRGDTIEYPFSFITNVQIVAYTGVSKFLS